MTKKIAVTVDSETNGIVVLTCKIITIYGCQPL